MNTSIQLSVIRLTCAAAMLLVGPDLPAAEWSVPMPGNTFRTAPQPGGNGAQQNGTVACSNLDDVFSVYFHVDLEFVLIEGDASSLLPFDS